ncbi:MAG TPA: GAF domain-containing protein [Oscillatoriales cyanobacterium M59_W2019_021]|nr:GAF domain-containing protein [Oscillatoriales cyanobacterium M4454_W2019_049]HIK50461.1 GAF domain-containing protein [Oscillatoriales cyanobacterium M59_W2019_021]
MPNLAFYKIATDQEVRDLLETIADRMKIDILIADRDGDIIIQNHSSIAPSQGQRYPIKASDELVGWAIVPEEFVWISSWFSYLCDRELEKQIFISKIWEREQEINLLQDISTQITSSLDVQEVTHLVLEEVGKFIPCTWGAISLLDPSIDRLVVYSKFGESFPDRNFIDRGANLLWSAIKNQSGEIVNRVEDDPRCPDYQRSIVSLICVPLKVHNKIIGTLEVGSEVLVEYTKDDLKIVTMFAKEAAVAIEKALLYEQSRNVAAIAQEQTFQLQQALYDLREPRKIDSGS